MEATEFEGIDEKQFLSDFNEAKYITLRLNNSWVKCNNYRDKGLLHKWRFELDIIWDELSSKTRKKSEKFFNKCTKIIQLHDLKIQKSQKSNNGTYNALRDKHRSLKWIQDEVGMGGKFSSPDQDDDIEE